MIGLSGRRFGPLAMATLAIVVVAACGGNDEESTTATATPTATQTASATNTPVPATPTPSIEDAVAVAYLAYWDAYSAALLNLDVSLVEGVASGEELERIREEIEMLRSDGVALRIRVEHDFAVIQAAADSAVVVDEIQDRSFYVDPVTKDPPTADVSGEVLTDSFEFERRENGDWVVVRSRRLSTP